MTMSVRDYTHDVAILGSGIAGSMLGAILARNGVKVLLIDAASHPRFAVGESTIPHLLVNLQIMATRYGVPEIATLTSVKTCTSEISNTFGVKRHFGFMLHRPGEEPDPRESNLFATPRVLNQSSHLFRQDSDAYMFRTAAKYGCDTRQNYRVLDVAPDADAVVLTGQDGVEYRARYLVDASGFRSVLAGKLELRETPCRFKHHSRSLFTHMIGVRPFDEVVDHPKEDRPPVRWHEGTMHHTFERGWFWIIPFDNYPESRNPLCSVGLTFDPRLYPRPADMTPEEEFLQVCARADLLVAAVQIADNRIRLRQDLAIELSFTSGRDRFRGSLRTLADNREQAFDLLRLALSAPRFDADAVARVRAQIIQAMPTTVGMP